MNRPISLKNTGALIQAVDRANRFAKIILLRVTIQRRYHCPATWNALCRATAGSTAKTERGLQSTPKVQPPPFGFFYGGPPNWGRTFQTPDRLCAPAFT